MCGVRWSVICAKHPVGLSKPMLYHPWYDNNTPLQDCCLVRAAVCGLGVQGKFFTIIIHGVVEFVPFVIVAIIRIASKFVPVSVIIHIHIWIA